jgi:hypothetical protein
MRAEASVQASAIVGIRKEVMIDKDFFVKVKLNFGGSWM